MSEEKSKDWWIERYIEVLKDKISQLEKEKRKLLIFCYLLVIFVFIPFTLLIFLNISKVGGVIYTIVYSDSDENMTEFARNYTQGMYGISAANKLSYWINRNIKYSCSGNLKASEVFRLRRGVCKENAVLLLSFMRSLNEYGVVEIVHNGEHAIAKIYDSKGYFYCDPTLGNPFADSCSNSFECRYDSLCNPLTHRCENKNSMSFCWRPY